MKIFKDYNLINRRLYKFNLDPQKHLLHRFGNTPAIDKNLWDKHKTDIDVIIFKTTTGDTYQIDTPTLEANKQVIDYGFGKQLVAPQAWKVTRMKPTPNYARFIQSKPYVKQTYAQAKLF